MNKPKDHQKEAISDILEGFATAERGQCIMPCGTGKTLVGLWTAERLGAELILLTAPTLALVKQLSETWAANASAPFAALAVCSDESVLKGELDDGVRVADIGERVTTDKKEVREFLRGGGRRVVFSTYHSSEVIQNAQAVKGSPRFDLLIADEAHRCAGGSGGPFQIVLGERKIKVDRRLFMTATPRWASKFHKQTELVGMDNPALFGEELHRLHYTDAVDRGLVVPFEVICVGCNSLEYAQMVKDEKMVRFPGIDKLPADDLMQRGMVLKAMKKYELKKVFSYHSRIASATEFADGIAELHEALPASDRPAGGLWAMSLDGSTPNAERSAILADFEAVESPAILSSCQVLSEGVDAPAADAVVFCDPMSSIIDTVQRLGRIARPFPGKKVAIVILPVVVPEADYDEALAGSAYRVAWNTLQALAAVDETFAAHLKGVARERGRTGEGTIQSDRLIFDFPKSVPGEFLDGFDSRVLEVTTTSFETGFGYLEAFVEEHGHARPPLSYITSDGFRLGSFVAVRRKMQRAGQLSRERVAMLESLPGWTCTVGQAHYERGLFCFVAFVAEHGHGRVPQKFKTADGFCLGEWMSTQRQSYANGKIDAERIAELEATFGWVWNEKDYRWMRHYEFLQEFADAHGHVGVARTLITADGLRPYSWMCTQRVNYGDGTLSRERVAMLESLPGWAWNMISFRFDNGLLHFKEFVAEHGHGRVPQGYVSSDGFKLSVWVGTQRTSHRRGTLSTACIDDLEAVVGWTWGQWRLVTSKKVAA